MKKSTNIDPRSDPNAMANFYLLARTKGTHIRPNEYILLLDRVAAAEAAVF